MFKMKSSLIASLAFAFSLAGGVRQASAEYGDVYVGASTGASDSEVVRFSSGGTGLGTLASRNAALNPVVLTSPVSMIAWVAWEDGIADRYDSNGAGLLGTDNNGGAGYGGSSSQRAVNTATGDLWIHKYYTGAVEGSPFFRLPSDGSTAQLVQNQYAYNFFGLNTNSFNGDMIFSDAGGNVSRATSAGTVFASGYAGWVNAHLAASPADGSIWFTDNNNIFKATSTYSSITAGPFAPPGAVSEMLVNPITDELWVAGTNFLTRYDSTASLGNVLAGPISHLAVDPATGDIYFSNGGDIYRANDLGVLQWGGLPVSGYSGLVDIAWNPASNSLFAAANTGGGILDSISPAGVATNISSSLGTISSLDVQVAPEPASLALLSLGGAVLLRRRRA
jgi:hypothetical protein